MAEVISEQQPRIKYELRRQSTHELTQAAAGPELGRLCGLMLRMEAAGAAPVLDDGKARMVGGNCAIDEALARAGGAAPAGASATGVVSSSSSGGGGVSSSGGGGISSYGSTILVSRSGKAVGASLAAGDFVRLTAFDRGPWAAEYESSSESLRPSSDAPLLWACLAPGAQAEYGWGAQPRVAFHGHALESGAGLEAARAHGIPISESETLFSTPEDLAELESLLRAHPYPQNRVYIRRGHGFFVLGDCVADCEAAFDTILAAVAEAGGLPAPPQLDAAAAVQPVVGAAAATAPAAAADAGAG